MKKTFLTFTMVLIFGFSTFASNADLFKLDYNAVQQEFTELNDIVNMVEANPDLTYSSLKMMHPGLVESISLIPNTALPMASGDSLLGIPSFWWGCCLGVVGVGLVYFLNDQDSTEAKKALWGCVVSAVVSSVVYLVAGVAALGAG